MATATKVVEPIAIIGSGCRFPGGATSPSRLWNLLKDPRTVASKPPATHFDIDSFYHENPSHPGTTNTREAYFLSDDPQPFDASFFNISAVEAESMDPQQRQVLEVVYESLEDAGLCLDSLQGSPTGIFCGVMGNDWEESLSVDSKLQPRLTATGAARSIIANRVSYFFDWHGPSVVIDTACSSSMVALHLAVTALQQQECSLALATGVNLLQSPKVFVSTAKIQMLSPTGRSRMWDAKADGYARGEGVASVVLKRLSDAISDGDSIDCIIRATGTNQDGRTMGITMPSGASQLQLIERTYARAGLNPTNFRDRCQYFEAHGTGTLAGDPQEASAIHNAFFGGLSERPATHPNGTANGTSSSISNGTSNGHTKKISDANGTSEYNHPMLVGSIKTVIGHTEGTAGLAGLLKASLSIQKGIVPPNLLFETLSPALEPYVASLRVVTEATPWPSLPPGVPRRVSVNSFGFGGTNAHAILESYEHPSSHITDTLSDAPLVLPFVFSAASERSLAEILVSYAKWLKENPSVSLADLAATLLHKRSALKVRLSLWASNVPELVRRLEEEALAIRTKKSVHIISRRCSSSLRVLGVFTGQGAQWTQMGWDLINASPQARIWLEEMEESLSQLPVKYRPSFSLLDEISNPASKMGSARLSQPLCTSLQIVLVNFLKAIGIEFASVVGHSSGEIAAAYAAGFLTASDAIRIAHLRGLMTSYAGADNDQPGAMLAAGVSVEEAEELCARSEGTVALAACNAPSLVTFSGDADAIHTLERQLKEENKFCRLLRVDKAYHSHHMRPCSRPYLEALKECGITPLNSTGTVWHSSVYPGVSVLKWDTSLVDEYWNANMVSPVLFSQALTTALKDHHALPDFVVEVGPHPALRGPVQQVIADLFPSTPQPPYLASCSRDISGFESLACLVGSIWAAIGLSALDLSKYMRLFGVPNASIPCTLTRTLPTYPFDHSRLYHTESRMLKRHLRHRGLPHPLLGTLEPESAEGELRWRHYLRQNDLPWLSGHRVQSQTVFPATGYVVMAMEAARQTSNKSIKLIQLDEVAIHQAIVLPEDEGAGIEVLFRLNLTSNDDDATAAHFHIHASTGDSLQLSASGRLEVIWGEPDTSQLPGSNMELPCDTHSLDIDQFYHFLSSMGYGYTNPFRRITGLSRTKDRSFGVIQNIQPDDGQYPFIAHPAVLDCALQTMLGAVGSPGDGELWTLLVPTLIKSVIINPATCGAGSTRDFQTQAEVVHPNASMTSGDVRLFTQGGHGAVQMEGVQIAPLVQPQTDRLIFSEILYGPLTPVAKAYPAPAGFSDYALTIERAALISVKLVHAQLTEDLRRSLDRHRARLASWMDRTLSLVRAGMHPTLKKEWLNDTQEDLDAIAAANSGSAVYDIALTVNASLPRFFRGEASILEEVRKIDGFTRFYRDDMELNAMNDRVGDVVEQLAFRYPRMKILEIGAGTGSATRSVLSKIERQYHSYTFTDISVGFFEQAKEVFQEHEDRFVYSALNIEKDPAEQGFEDASFDLIVAANCLHATKSMHETMTHVRRLLKPGGHLVMLEITNADLIRTTYLMGGLEGWWAGENDGRVWGPMLLPSDWESLLRQTGFSGIDLRIGYGDPKLTQYEVIASQAVDTQIQLLRDPLGTFAQQQPSAQSDTTLLLLGGSTSKTSALIRQITELVGFHFRHITSVSTLESLSLEGMHDLTVMSLIDIDAPCFRDLTRERLRGLQRLILATSKLLWVSSGSETENPFLAMSMGWLKALATERKRTIFQYLNIESPGAVKGELLAENLMRLAHASGPNDHTLPDQVYTTEPILYYRNGRMEICRVRSESRVNQRYLSSRKWQSRQVDLHDTASILRLVPTSSGRHDLRVLEKQPHRTSNDDLTIRVHYSTASAVAVGNSFLYLICGEDAVTGTRMVALSRGLQSELRIPSSWACEVPSAFSHGSAAQFLQLVASAILADALIDLTASSSTLFVHEADPTLQRVLWSRALVKNISLFFTTGHPAFGMPNVTLLHPRASKWELRKLLPQEISVAASFERGPSSSSVFARALTQLPSPVKVKVLGTFYQPTAQHHSDTRGELTSLLSKYCRLAGQMYDTHGPIDLVSVDAMSSTPVHPSQVVDWTQNVSLCAQVEPVTSQVNLSSNKTYLLAGMTGDFGRSLCQWMVSRGAQHVVLTSRNPKIPRQWIQTMEESGAQVISMPMDLADRESVISVYRRIQQQRLPPLAGVVHGALHLEDLTFEDHTLKTFEATTAPKIQGSLILDELSGPDVNLDFFILFGTLAGVVGNLNQTAYSAPTALQSSLIKSRRKRGLVGSIVHPGIFASVGYVARKSSRWMEHVRKATGSLLLSEHDLDKLFAEAILAGHPESNRNPELVIGVPLMDPVAQPDVFWYTNPLTWDFIDYSLKSNAHASGSTPQGSARALLESATNMDEVREVITVALIAQVRSKLNMAEDAVVTGDTQLNDLGLDSLVAVDLRTWFSRELVVDIPLLQIMSGARIEELTAAAASKLSDSMIPLVQGRDGAEEGQSNGA
ncbi:hypothetical protein BJY04DRAFT_216165 [Aspergillus karnatakaensis]|uniref:uncharacterized protein n=1 Tax=Aspergillus karnatakaensis TaxID=1810916 RepID=UPI003CCDAB84